LRHHFQRRTTAEPVVFCSGVQLWGVIIIRQSHLASSTSTHVLLHSTTSKF
jgi:hypothetical protein